MPLRNEFVNDSVESSVASDNVIGSAPSISDIPMCSLILLSAQARTDAMAINDNLSGSARSNGTVDRVTAGRVFSWRAVVF